MARLWVCALGVLLAAGCGDSGHVPDGGPEGPSPSSEPPPDAGEGPPTEPPDAGRGGKPPTADAGPEPDDAGTEDAGTEDAGTPDAGTPDGGGKPPGRTDAGTPDGGGGDTDAGTPDGGPPPVTGGPATRSVQWRASYYAGVSPGGLVVSDFNGDGAPDVAINALGRGFQSQYKARPGQFLLFLNDGQGVLGKPAWRHRLDSSSGKIAAGQAGPDGHLDVLVGTRYSAHLLHGLGDGSFSAESTRFGPGITSSLGFWPGSGNSPPFLWATGGFDDISGPSTLAGFQFLSATSTGAWEARDLVDEGGWPVVNHLASPGAAAVADFNEDGHADVVLASDRWALALFEGGASGRFYRRANNMWMYATLVRVADFNGDGHADVFAVRDDYLHLYLGSGAGDFTLNGQLWLEAVPTHFTVADVNADGSLDLVFVFGAKNRLGIRRGDGNMWFGQQQWLATGRQPTDVAVADLDGDGRRELLVTEAGDNALSIYDVPTQPLAEPSPESRCPMVLRDGQVPSKAPAPLVTVDAGVGTEDVTAGDFDGNGYGDLALPLPDQGLRLVLGQPGGKFVVRDEPGVGRVHRAVAGDFNGDQRDDLAAITQQLSQDPGTGYSPVLRLLWSTGVARFIAYTDISVYAEDGGHLAAEDLDGDGMVDLAATLNTPCTLAGTVFFNQGKGSLVQRPLPDHNVEPDDQCGGSGPPVVADFNRDGMLDVLHATLGFNLNYTGPGATVLPGEGFESGFPGHYVRTAADVDGDGAVDLLLSGALGELTVLRGDKGGTLQAPLACELKAAGQVPLEAMDVNGDGITDLLGRDKGGSSVVVVLGEGRGAYHLVRRYPLEAKPLWVRPVDLMGDARPELVVLLDSGTLLVFSTPEP